MSLPTSKSWPSFDEDRSFRHLGEQSGEQNLVAPMACLAGLGLLVSLGLLLTLRRFDGAFSSDLPRSSLLITALVSAALAAYLRWGWRQRFPLAAQPTWGDVVVGWGSSLSLVLVAVGCSFPGNRASDWLIWVPLLVTDLLWRQDFFDGGDPAVQAGQGSTIATPAPLPPGTADAQAALPADCSQQIFRVREPDGQEAIYATLQADFQAGQRHATVYVGFCPPLAGRPEIEADPAAGPPAEIKIGQSFSHGARLDLKLAAAARQPTQVLVDLVARCPSIGQQ